MQQAGQVRTLVYNSLGRLTQTTQPENGVTQYFYDGNGNLLKRIDATSKVFEFKPPSSPPGEKAYDGLNRPRRKTIQQPSGPDQEVLWTWDSAVNGKGQLAVLTYGDTQLTYGSYDLLGRVVNHAQITGFTTYPFSYEYFANDQLKKITYPSGRTVTYALDTAGRTTSATGLKNATATNYAGGITYTPHGAFRQMDLGGGSGVRANWSAFNGKLQLEGFSVSRIPAPTPALMTLSYSYGGSANNGNPLTHTVNDGVQNRTQSFGYDAANRLSMACEAPAGTIGCTVNPAVTWPGPG